jgi:8-amino-7-oxononanoate synthase
LVIPGLEKKWLEILQARKEQQLFRRFGPVRDSSAIDFYSNDYLGLANSPDSRERLKSALEEPFALGASGSRLVSGQQAELELLEAECSHFFSSETGIFFPSGFMANLALFSCMAGRHDTILYDVQSHVSIKEGIRLSQARSYSFRHNDPEDLRKKLKNQDGQKFVALEGIYSMSGHKANLEELAQVCREEDALLIVDEAHSTGVTGSRGEGLSLDRNLKDYIWVRNYTFGKALGASGAFLALSSVARDFLINFSYPLIYSTAAPPVQVKLCRIQLQQLQNSGPKIKALQNIIEFWCRGSDKKSSLISANPESPVQFIRVPGNERALQLAHRFNELGFQIKAMLSPTVKAGEEGLRVSLHSFNTPEEIKRLDLALKEFKNIFDDRF